MAIKKYKDDFILLVEGGYIAVNQADEDGALKLFRAAELLQPDNSLCKVGFGYLHLHKLELKQAVKIFQEVLDKEPNELKPKFEALQSLVNEVTTELYKNASSPPNKDQQNAGGTEGQQSTENQTNESSPNDETKSN